MTPKIYFEIHFSADGFIQINSNIENLGGFTPIMDSTGKITGYKTEAGADTVFPFSSNIYGRGWHIANCSSMSINIDFKDIPGWKNLTLNDFIWAPSGVLTTSHPYAGGYSVTKATFSASYNSSNGIFTLSFSQRHNGSAAGEETPSYKGLVAVGIKV